MIPDKLLVRAEGQFSQGNFESYNELWNGLGGKRDLKAQPIPATAMGRDTFIRPGCSRPHPAALHTSRDGAAPASPEVTGAVCCWPQEVEKGHLVWNKDRLSWPRPLFPGLARAYTWNLQWFLCFVAHSLIPGCGSTH